ncbi:MAG: BMP family ABC transporter substrate-binding protein [Chloroflexi bacterium]|nr:BMP family ABC transporter substrate-binding protein [Chloroflexota bacterium]|tara:strand:- start:68296 stop:69543 length:1248 start_codon:yes stop_codon:yes gene_type:complete
MKIFINLLLVSILSISLFACGTSEDEEAVTQEEVAQDSDEGKDHEGHGHDEMEPFKFGVILVGPRDDKGWSQAHFEGGEYIEEISGGEMIVADMINPADSPNLTVDQVVSDMIDEGAQLVFATSDDMKDGILAAAEKFPDVPMVWASGDSAWNDGKAYRGDLENLGNIMGKMEYGKMIAGCAAALKTKTGKISFLGPLINDETRRLANAAYLGASHCYDGDDLSFEVVWIGFWFHIPGVTSDPTQVANEFFDGGSDVIISHIDTPEALVVTGQRAAEGEDVFVVGYDYENSCDTAPEVCLGVPYFNWGPDYLNAAMNAAHGEFNAEFLWSEPNWEDMNDKDSSPIGWKTGDGLNDSEKGKLDSFIGTLSSGNLNLFTGPLNFQDGSEYLSDGQEASDSEIWYTPQLLEGMTGDSQ